jgi:predicted negative regulator of RcsB-dependent stress response
MIDKLRWWWRDNGFKVFVAAVFVGVFVLGYWTGQDSTTNEWERRTSLWSTPVESARREERAGRACYRAGFLDGVLELKQAKSFRYCWITP